MRHVAPIKIALMVLLFTAVALAQRDLGTIVGTVTDQQGAAVPNAKVTITEDATGLTYQLNTSASGEFVRPALKPSTYSVEVEAPGFKKSVHHNILLTAGDRTGVNIALTVGEVNQSIEVSASAPLLQTESTIVGADVSSKQVSELPLGGQRTFSFLARLSPGVVPAEPGARDAQGGGFSANGVRANGQNNFLLNGVDNNVNVIDFLNQTSFVIGPSVDAIGEMRIMTNGYNAEYGRGAGGVVNVTLKSGSNEIHGSLFEYLQNRDLNANRWENNANGNPRGAYGQNQFGAAVGGPAIKNRTFWFADYQGTRLTSTGGAVANLGTSGYFTVPTPDMINGNFSRLIAPDGSGIIYDPTTTKTVNGNLSRTPYPNNTIPASQIDPAAAKIMGLFPKPNAAFPATGIPQNDFFTTTSGNLNTNQWDIRADHRITDKDSIFGSISWSTTDKFNAQPLPGALDATYFNSNSEEDLARNAMISYTRVWTPAIISETRVGFSRLVTSRTQADPNTDQYKAFGIGGYDPTGPLNGGLPSVNMNRYSGWGASDWLPSKEYNNEMDFIQNLSVTKGTHSYKFGAEFREIKFPFFQVPSPHGDMTFDRRSTAMPTATGANNSGDEYASFLIGQVYGGQLSTTNFISSQKTAWAFYGQDDWKISRKLTINYGLRYELFSPIGERFGRQSNFDFQNLTLYIPTGPNQNAALPPNFATAFPQVTVSRGQVSNTLIPWHKTDFGPRIGLAYSIMPTTVFRIGYGIFYGGEENQGGNPNRGESVPFNETVNLGTPAGTGVFDTNPYFSGGLKAGFPVNVFTLPAPISFRGISTDFRNSLVHKWNAAIQHEFRGGNALEVSYVGNHQAHQLLQPDFNACPNSPIPNLNCNDLRPYPNIGSVSGTGSNGFGNYHGMTAKLEKRFAAGMRYLFSYTYGHALSNSGTTLSGSNGFTYLDNTNLSTSYSSAAWDIRHSVVASFLYEFPFGRGKKYGGQINRGVDAILGGWQMNSIFTFRTGSPFTIRGNNCIGLFNGCFGQLTTGMSSNSAPSNGRGPNEWFNIAAFGTVSSSGVFTPNVPPPGTYGNNGLQTNYGPGQRNVDLSLFKGFKITERFKAQFRAEAFNIGNTPQWGTPDNNVYDSNFGKITSTQTGSERRLQMALRVMF